MDRDLYQRIVSTYQQTGSVDRTAEFCKTYAIKVRKVLITEGLWHSKKSDAVNSLRDRGYSVAEIAEELEMEEKNVQFYLPYSNNSLTDEKTDSTERVAAFRQRSRNAAEGNRTREQESESRTTPQVDPKAEKLAQQKRKASDVQKWNEKNRPHRSISEKRNEKNRPYRSKWKGYQLHVELVRNDYLSNSEDEQDIFQGVSDAAALRSLLKTNNGISRDVIVPGTMSLHQLSYVIQELFGFMNCHLHHFSLPKALLQQLTEGDVTKWAEMCGVYLHVPVAEDFSDLYWDDDYRPNKSANNWMRSKYIGEQKNYAVGETYIDSMRLLKEETEWIEEVMKEEGDTRRFQDLSLEEYIREYVVEGNPDALLERLCVEDLLTTETLQPEETGVWRDAMRQDIEASLTYLEAFRKTRSFRSLEDAMGVLRMMREDRDNLEKAIWLKRDEVKALYGRNPDKVLEEHDTEVHKLERQIGDAMHVFDPPARPVTDTLYYHYDYGDDWLFRITCSEIYSFQDEEISTKETSEALRQIKGNLNAYDQRIENKLEAAGWGKDYMEEFIFEDSKGRELHNMFYVPLCASYLEAGPVLIAAEGLPLVEDVGGINGYFEFICDIHGDDKEKAASLRQWARSLGWKEIVPRAGKQL